MLVIVLVASIKLGLGLVLVAQVIDFLSVFALNFD